MDYYYQNPGAERVGPIDEATFFMHANAGAIFPNALVWREGEEPWQVWANVASAWTNGDACVPAITEEEDESGDSEVGLISADVGTDSFFGNAWEIFKRHWGKFILSGMLMGVLTMISEGGNTWIDSCERAGEALPAGVVFGVVSVSFIFSVISGALSFGYLKITRKEDAGEEVRLGDIFPLGRCLRKMFKFLGSGLIFMLITIPIYLLMTLPILVGMELSDTGYDLSSEGSFLLFAVFMITLFGGFALLLWLMARLLFVFMFVFDTDCGVFDAFKASWRITRGRFFRTFGYGVLTSLILVFGTLFTLGLGAILLVPLSVIWFAVYYIKLCKTCETEIPESSLAGTLD